MRTSAFKCVMITYLTTYMKVLVVYVLQYKGTDVTEEQELFYRSFNAGFLTVEAEDRKEDSKRNLSFYQIEHKIRADWER